MRGNRQGFGRGQGRGRGFGMRQGRGFFNVDNHRGFGGRFALEGNISRDLKDGSGIGQGRGGRNAHNAPCQGNGEGFGRGNGRGLGYNRADRAISKD